MKKHIIIGHQEIEYTLIQKNIKRIYIKVIKGEIVVSAPYMTPIEYIEKMLIRYQDKLLERINQYTSYYDYRDHGYVDIFLKRYRIKLLDVGRYQSHIHHDDIYVYHRNIEKCVEKYLKDLLYNYIQERVIYYLAHVFDLDMPEIEIKKYKGRWGSCFYQQNKVTFNLSLVHLDKKLIDYVIIHELVHFLEPNHSSKFYQEIERRMPDYKQRIKALKEVHV